MLTRFSCPSCPTEILALASEAAHRCPARHNLWTRLAPEFDSPVDHTPDQPKALARHKRTISARTRGTN